MTRLTEIARAKVNLTLGVLGRRPDGFHELQSLVAFAGIGDAVTLIPGDREHVTTTGRFAPTLAGENLIARAMARARETAPGLVTGRVMLDKQLPVAAGLGGGSADAAAVLRLLRRVNPDVEIDWRALAGTIGADVPICLVNRAAFMTGTGERITPAETLPPLQAVLINPMVPVPADKTAQVFRLLSAPALPAGFERVPQPGPFSSVDQLLAYVADHGNDLERPARSLVPVIAEVLAALARSPDCRMARMSGGGPTCFGVYSSVQDATAAATLIAGAHPTWWVVATDLG